MNGLAFIHFKNFTSRDGVQLENGFITPIYDNFDVTAQKRINFEAKNIFINNLFPNSEKGYYKHETKKTLILPLNGELELRIQTPEKKEFAFRLNPTMEFQAVIIEPQVEFKLKNCTDTILMLLHINNEVWDNKNSV